MVGADALDDDEFLDRLLAGAAAIPFLNQRQHAFEVRHLEEGGGGGWKGGKRGEVCKCECVCFGSRPDVSERVWAR